MIKHFKLNDEITSLTIPIFLVDELNIFETFGTTTTSEKIKHNLRLLKNLNLINESEEKLISSEKGLTSAYAIGQYLIIIENEIYERDTIMYFLYHEVPDSDLYEVITTFGSDNLTEVCIQLKEESEKSGNFIFDYILLMK